MQLASPNAFQSLQANTEPAVDPLWEWRDGHRRTRLRLGGIAALGIILVALAALRCNVSLSDFARGIGKGLPLLLMFFPPEWTAFGRMVEPIGVTIGLALLATLLGTCLSVPFALAASSNVAPSWLRWASRSLITLERGLPEIVILLLCVAAFGLGPFPGAIALSVASIGMLAKLLADSIEEIEPQLLESVKATGASDWQVIRYAILPQVAPSLFANCLFRFEVNVRASVLLGAVGAGGIGYELNVAMEALEYRRATVAVLASLFLVFFSERVSDFMRTRILAGEKL